VMQWKPRGGGGGKRIVDWYRKMATEIGRRQWHWEIHTHTHTHTHTHMYACIHTHKHTYVRTYIHTHTHMGYMQTFECRCKLIVACPVWVQAQIEADNTLPEVSILQYCIFLSQSVVIQPTEKFLSVEPEVSSPPKQKPGGPYFDPAKVGYLWFCNTTSWTLTWKYLTLTDIGLFM
jgi:hypothetical protein